MSILINQSEGKFQGRLFRKYAVYLAGLLSITLLASGIAGLYFSYRDTRALVDELEHEKARGAAVRIEQFVRGIEAQLRGALPFGHAGRTTDIEQRYLDLLRLLQLAPAVADAAWIDATGRERVRVSRVSRDVLASNLDRSSEPGFTSASAGKTWYGPVYFRGETEPYLSAAVTGVHNDAGVIITEINLKFVRDIVSAIRVGTAGHAYVVDAHGRLISHPDIAKVLRMTDLSALPQVRAAIASFGRDSFHTLIARDEANSLTLTAYAPIEALNWSVLVEQPLTQAFAPLYNSAIRSAVVLLLGIVLAAAASIVLARRMVAPIRALEAGAERIGHGRLDEPVVVETGDELQGLAEQFNLMAQKLRNSYGNLEQKIHDRTRELAEANRAKSRFLAGASHDLRQPVHALGLFVAQLQQVQDPLLRQRIIGKIEASTAAVSELIEALLDISKLDSGTVEAQAAEFALQPLLDRIEQAFSLAARAKDLRLRVRPTPLRVSTDPILLERILLNFAANAVRYTGQGGVLIGVRQRRARARIEVWDTGVGISREAQCHIFEEFYRIDDAGSHQTQGLGLGLAIVDRLARLLGLAVSLRSVAGRGSVFAIEVPIASGALISIAPLTSKRDVVRFDNLCVLLIDDDTAAREATEGLLAQWGCRVLSASSGSEAVDLARANAPAVIVSDYRLGTLELGTEVVQRLRTRLGNDIPALIVSADASAASSAAVAAAGMHLLHKPLKPGQLRALLHHVLVAGSAATSAVPNRS